MDRLGPLVFIPLPEDNLLPNIEYVNTLIPLQTWLIIHNLSLLGHSLV